MDSIIRQKIKTQKEIKEIAEKLKKEGKIIVQCHGIYDLVHPGNIYQFDQAKQVGDVLIVSLVEDEYVRKGPGIPHFSEQLRAEWLASFSQVDYVVFCESEGPWEVMKAIRPDIYIIGKDIEHLLNDPTSGLSKDKNLVESLGGRVHLTDYLPIHSYDLLQEFLNIHPPEVKEFLDIFRMKYSREELKKQIALLKRMKVLVVGEIIIDEYQYVSVIGKASKSSIISTKYVEREMFAGGSLACANHLSDFCESVHLLAYLGKEDTKEDFIRSYTKQNVVPIFFYRENDLTIIKRRFVDSEYNNKLFEVCFLNDDCIESDLESEIADWLDCNLANFDAVIVADYGHGLLTPRLIEILSRKSKFLAVNAQTNSANHGFNPITKYPKADYVCLNESEIRVATRDKSSDVKKLMRLLCNDIPIKKMSITRGRHGIIIYDGNSDFCEVPALSKNVIDPIGAGDSYLVISALAAAAGFPSEVVGFLGSIACSIAVQIVCNRSSIRMSDFMKTLETLI